MPILTTLLLAVVVALCPRDTVAGSVVLEATEVQLRTPWGENGVLLICRSAESGEPIPSAMFTRDQESITISDHDDCTPIDNQYCYDQDGERLSFTATNATEGKYACLDESHQPSNELAIVAYPDQVWNGTLLEGEWGVNLNLPCRFAPGPLADDPANFYYHTWDSILNGTMTSVSSNDNFQDNDDDFSLTLVKLNPILAEYNYLCNVDFSPPTLLQPYTLRESLGGEEAVIDVVIKEIDGDVSIEREPINAVVSANEPATFSCTLNVATGKEKLHFGVFNSTFSDRLSECHFDTTPQTHCSWLHDGINMINMTCDYSVPYQITCKLTLSGLNESSSTQVNCSSGMGVDAVSATAGLAVRIDKAPTPRIVPDELSSNLNVTFNLPAIPYIPLEVEVILFKGGEEDHRINPTNHTGSKEVEFSISDVPEGIISVRIRVKYEGDDGFSNESDMSNSLVVGEVPSSSFSAITTATTTPTTPPTSVSPTAGGDSTNNNAESPTVYVILGGFGALLLLIFIFVLVLACLLYRKKDGRSAKIGLGNGYGPDPHDPTPLMQVRVMKDPNRSYSGSRSHSPPDNISNTNTTNTSIPDASPSHQSHNGSCYCRMDHSSASEGSHRYLQVDRYPRLPRYGYPADESFQTCPVHPPPLSLPICAIDSIPGISVQAPTPVTPANTEPFVPSTVNTPDFVDDQYNSTPHTVRPGILHIPSSANSPPGLPTPGTSTPISSEVALSIAMYLKHKDCQDKDNCPTCRMIDNRFTKLLTRYETKELNKLASSGAVKSKLRQKHRPARSPRTANALRPHLVRQRSMSMSHVNEDELTLSSTETEDDGIQTDMDKRRRTKESHLPMRNPGLLSLRDIPKDIAASDSELVSTPSGRIGSSRKATSPMKATRQAHHLPVPLDSFSSNEDSQATDGSDTSSHKHNSHPDLTSQLPVTTTFLNPTSKHHHNSAFSKYHSVVSTSGYSSQSDNDSTVFRPVPSSYRQGGRVFCSDESVDNYHSDGYSYNSYTDYPVSKSHQHQRRKVSLDTVFSSPSPSHYPGHHSLERTGVSLMGNGHAQASVYSASAALYSHRPQDRLGRPSSASPSHGSHKSSISYSSGKPHARSMSPIVSLPTSQSQATPL